MAFRLSVMCCLLFGILVCIALRPVLLYAHESRHDIYSILHQKPFDPSLVSHVDAAMKLTTSSELYDGSLHLQICLNDGSDYPGFIEKVKGQAFCSWIL